MKKIFLPVLMIFLCLSSCKKDEKPEVSTKDEKKDASIDSVTKKEELQVKFSNKTDQKLYQVYIEIKSALVNSDSISVQKSAKKIEDIVISSEETKQLKATSKLISLTKDLKKQRDFFISLTQEIEKQIRMSEITSGAVYKQFCPMAFDGEGGYWLSDSKEIRNPYFGDKMLTCGHIKEVFE
ncbi:DUF3347 domain-containing protein [Aquimarina pacifica]|uniref:DUF3347 domain-containing protein n=1 Tax=Aquimarina pacifica TaxID=1296415 RepID=UPI00055778A3|nr:DUF3347 domain-containing protein [Aquimarina pacifica]